MLLDRQANAKALADTYATINNRTGWERAQEYQRVLEWRGDHPNAGSQAASSALELSRSRIRPWFDGAKPDPTHAIDTAEKNDWLDMQPGEPTFEAMVVLTAWIFAGGSIDQERYVPLFAVGPTDPQPLLETALTAVGCPPTTSRDDEPGRATELRPNGDGASHLGRFLHAVMGAPVGEKANRTDLTLPNWLDTVGAATWLRFARTYVNLRATPVDERHGYTRQLKEERAQPFIESLGDLFQALCPAETVSTGKQIIRLRPAATRELDVIPSLPLSPAHD